MSRDRVVLTASAGAFPGLATALGDLGIPLEVRPLLRFVSPSDWNQLDTALEQRYRYRAMALTSPRASQAVAERIGARRVTWDGPAPIIWVVGSVTEESLRGRAGPVRKPDTPPIPGESAAGSLARAMLTAQVGTPVLFPCGDRRRDELPNLLRSHGIQVDEVVCYRTILASREEAQAAAAGSTVVVVASPSVAALLAEACSGPSRPRLVAIGAATAYAALAAGWPPAAVAGEPSTAALSAAIAGLLATR
jgi:uroporphyrinogen-III synthase